MTEEELEFYYFQVHDTDKNSKLDGLELLQAILHTDSYYEDLDEENGSGMAKTEVADFSYFVGKLTCETLTNIKKKLPLFYPLVLC